MSTATKLELIAAIAIGAATLILILKKNKDAIAPVQGVHPLSWIETVLKW